MVVKIQPYYKKDEKTLYTLTGGIYTECKGESSGNGGIEIYRSERP